MDGKMSVYEHQRSSSCCAKRKRADTLMTSPVTAIPSPQEEEEEDLESLVVQDTPVKDENQSRRKRHRRSKITSATTSLPSTPKQQSSVLESLVVQDTPDAKPLHSQINLPNSPSLESPPAPLGIPPTSVFPLQQQSPPVSFEFPESPGNPDQTQETENDSNAENPIGISLTDNHAPLGNIFPFHEPLYENPSFQEPPLENPLPASQNLFFEDPTPINLSFDEPTLENLIFAEPSRENRFTDEPSSETLETLAQTPGNFQTIIVLSSDSERGSSENSKNWLKGGQQSSLGGASGGTTSSTKFESEKIPKTEEADERGGKLQCLQQLKEELSCAVCLDICFEPSSTSCGHSFCRSCLENAVLRCGYRCPKCRTPLKDTSDIFPINTVIWNTIQLLFPEEVAAKKESLKPKDNVNIDSDDEGVVRFHRPGRRVRQRITETPFRNPFPIDDDDNDSAEQIASDEELALRLQEEEYGRGSREEAVAIRNSPRRNSARRNNSNSARRRATRPAVVADRTTGNISVTAAAANLRALAFDAIHFRSRR